MAKSRRLPKSKKSKKRKIKVVESSRGLVHLFDINNLEKMAKHFANTYSERLKNDLMFSTPFWDWLKSQPNPTAEHIIDYQKPLYKAVDGSWNPLSIAGSLADGGRFNVGGAQLTNFSPLNELRKFGCIYAADNIECAKAEISSGAIPSLNQKKYIITANRSLKLWNLESIIAGLDWPKIVDLVSAIPNEAMWSLQKTPKISQIISFWLKQMNCADGLMYPSTKHPGSYVVTLFANDDIAASKLLSSSEYQEEIQTEMNIK